MKDTKQPAQASHPTSKGVQTLLGNPKKAIIKLSIPMIVAMSVHTLYNFVDGLWVAGLGPDALSAVGFFFPFFFLIMALSAGIGVGGSAAVSRMQKKRRFCRRSHNGFDGDRRISPRSPLFHFCPNDLHPFGGRPCRHDGR
jgi:Na+-driven multidrug efflux pump